MSIFSKNKKKRRERAAASRESTPVFIRRARFGIWLEGNDVRISDWEGGEINLSREDAVMLAGLIERGGDA